MNLEEKVTADAHIREVFSDESFVKQLLTMQDSEDIQAKLKEKEIDMTLEEIELLPMVIQKLQENSNDAENFAKKNQIRSIVLIVGACIIGALIILNSIRKVYGW